MRAAQTQALLHATARLAPEERRAVFARIGEEAVAQIESSIGLAWLPMALHMDLSDAVRAAVGPRRNVDVWRETMLATWSRPLLRGFVETVTKVFGLGPGGIVRQAPRIYGHLTKGCGEISFEAAAGGDGARVVLTGFPADRFDFDCYVEGTQGCIESTFPLTRTRGEVSVVSKTPERGEVHYELRWKPTGGPV
jgi:hypothetical protein